MGLTLLFFLLYIVAVVVIGVLSSRKSDEEDFMIAGRKVKGIQIAASMSASFFDGAVLSIYMAYMYQFGISAIWMFVGLGAGFLLLRKYAFKIKQKADTLKVYSMPEYFYKILGKKNGLMFSFLLTLQFFLLLIVNLIISGKVLSSIFSLPYFVSVIIGGVIILTYLMLAGFKAVIRTDFFQFLIMILLSVTVAAVLFGKTSIPSTDLHLLSAGAGNIIGFLILGGLGIMVAPDLWQRIFASKDEANLKKGLSLSVILLPLLALVIGIIGLITKQVFPNILPEDALITGFSHLLPMGLKQLGIVLLYAVALSSSDTIVFVVSSILTRDFKNYSSKYSENSMKSLTRFFMVMFVLFAIIIASFYQNILALGLSLASLNLALFPAVFGTFYWKLKEKAVFWSLILAFLSVFILFIANALNPQTAVISLPVALFSLFILQKVLKKNKLKEV